MEVSGLSPLLSAVTFVVLFIGVHMQPATQFWPVSPLAASSSLADVQDNDVTSCWEPAAHASDLNVETFITLHTNDTLTFPLEVEVKLQAVSGCGDDPSVPLLLSLSTPPSIYDGSAWTTAPNVNATLCSFKSSADAANDVKVCTYTCSAPVGQSVPNPAGYGVRIPTLTALGGAAKICEIAPISQVA